jgi:RNA polymerase subunit RPABC4/transcription elongation factor Spt4
MKCPECGTRIPRGAGECPSCGYPALAARTRTRRCPNCGERIRAEAEACPLCGALQQPVPEACEVHPERGAKGECVVCGRLLCSAHRIEKEHEYLCPDHASVPVVEGWAQVYTTNDEIEAQLIEQNLRAEGIEARVLSQKDHYSFTTSLGDLSPVRVLVPAFAYREARRVIRAHRDDRGGVLFACPNCGELYEAGTEVCPVCGERLP